MIKIGEQYVNAEVEDIISKLKEVTLNQGLNYFYKSMDTPNNYMVCCPFHKNGQEKKPSMGIHKKSGVSHCFACGWTGTIDEMVSNLFGYMDYGVYGYKWLIRNFNAISVEERGDIDLDVSRETKKEEIKYVTEEELDSYRYYHPYWAKRGITNKELIELFDLGYDSSNDCITFPIRDIQGRTLFVARRSVKTKYFNYPSGAEKPLYGLYEYFKMFQLTVDKTRPQRCGKSYAIGKFNEVIVCESMIDALRFWQIGKYAVALNGLGNDLQFKQLQELPCRKLILCTDMDNAGLNARKNIKSKVSNKIITEYFLPDGRKDAGECTDDELNSLQDLF